MKKYLTVLFFLAIAIFAYSLPQNPKSGVGGEEFNGGGDLKIEKITVDSNVMGGVETSVFREEKNPGGRSLVIVEGNISVEEAVNAVEKYRKGIKEENVEVSEVSPGIYRVRKSSGVIEGISGIKKEVVDKVAKRLGLGEINVGERMGKVVYRVGTHVVFKTLLIERNVVIGREVNYDEASGRSEVRVVLSAQSPGIFYVEENLPKPPEGEVEVNVDENLVVLSFDPVLVWVVKLSDGEVKESRYRVSSAVPPELQPEVSELAGCNVDVKLLKAENRGDRVVGSFQILVGGVPAYVKSVSVNGEYAFIRKGMYYVFEVKGDRVVIEGKVGDCPFYREEVVQSFVPYMLFFAVLILLLVVLFKVMAMVGE